MAERTPRILWDNLGRRAATVMASSSEDSAATLAAFKDPQVTRYWRSIAGWNVNTWNNKIDFHSDVPVGVATIPTGNYATGAALCTAMNVALAAASPSHAAITFTYDAVTGTFHYHKDAGATVVSVKFQSGANAANGIGPDIGWTVDTTNTPGSADQDGTAGVFGSREWIRFDFGSALVFKVAVLLGHNLGTGGTVTLVAKSTPDIWSSPAFSQVLGGDALATRRIAFFAEQTYRYVGFMFSGFTAQSIAAAVGYVGGYFEPSKGYEPGLTRTPVLLGHTDVNIDGSLFRDRRRMPLELGLEFKLLTMTDVTTFLQLLDETQAGRVFLALDPLNFPGLRTHYGVIASPGGIVESVGDGLPPDRFAIPFTFREEKEEANP
jgi:hypothetical protein